MIQLLINGLFFLACASFGMYSMYKNDSVVTNRWLYLLGWFMFVCVVCLAAINFIDYFVAKGILDMDGIMDRVGNGIHANISDYVTGFAYVLFGFYLFR